MKRSLVISCSMLLLSQTIHSAGLDEIFDQGEGQKNQTQQAVKTNPFIATLQRVLPDQVQAQVLYRLIENENWSETLLRFNEIYKNQSFYKTENGSALLGYLMLKAGLPVTGLETLFAAADTKNIDSELKNEWKHVMPLGNPVWATARLQWADQWTDFFGFEIGTLVRAKAAMEAEDVEALKQISAQSTDQSVVKAWADWQSIMILSQKNESEQAAKMLAQLMKNPKAPVSMDVMNLTVGRLLYQNAYFGPAIRYYQKIAKSSAYWLDAQEEIAWSYVRKGELQNALAVSQSLVSDLFRNQISAESYFVRSVAQLKSCDYEGTLKTLQQFPKAFKQRTKDLEALSKGADKGLIQKVIAVLKKSNPRLSDLGTMANVLPRDILRDEKIKRFVRMQKMFEAEANTSEKLYAQSLSVTGVQGFFEELKNNNLSRASSAENASTTRIENLAQIEVADNKEVLKKLHLVETELLQQITRVETLVKNNTADPNKVLQGNTGSQTKDTLTFAANDEVWLDEIGNYKVNMKKACTVKR